jgi:hypothetical protein
MKRRPAFEMGSPDVMFETMSQVAVNAPRRELFVLREQLR